MLVKRYIPEKVEIGYICPCCDYRTIGLLYVASEYNAQTCPKCHSAFMRIDYVQVVG